MEGHANAALRDHVIKSSAVYSVTECGLMCLRVLSCKSFNTCSGKSELLCELNSAMNYEFEEDFLWKIDCSYYNAINGSTF